MTILVTRAYRLASIVHGIITGNWEQRRVSALWWRPCECWCSCWKDNDATRDDDSLDEARERARTRTNCSHCAPVIGLVAANRLTVSCTPITMINSDPMFGSEYASASFFLSPSCDFGRRFCGTGRTGGCGGRTNETNRGASTNRHAPLINPFRRLDALAPSIAVDLIPPIMKMRANATSPCVRNSNRSRCVREWFDIWSIF